MTEAEVEVIQLQTKEPRGLTAPTRSQKKREYQREHGPDDASIFGLLASRLGENTFLLLYATSWWYFVTAALANSSSHFW